MPNPASQFIIAPRAQASRRCETQASLGATRRALLPFRSLDPFRALREPDRRRRDEERLSRSEQRTDNNQKRRLDRKSPIQVRIPLPPAASLVPALNSAAAGEKTGLGIRLCHSSYEVE